MELKLNNRGEYKGFVTLIDDEDYDLVKNYSWLARKSKYGPYARHIVCEGTKVIKEISMHRLIMNCPVGKIIDHINGDTLDNRKSNLRICTYQQNNCNAKKKRSYNKYRGVYKHPAGKWEAYIVKQRKKKFLGYFSNEEDAARSYDKAAKEYHGEFARYNFPENT